jgi:putative aldouronate transport system permease protein
MLYPLWFVLIASFSSPNAVNIGDVAFYPKGFQIEGYLNIFKNEWILTGYRNSLFYTVFGTLLNLAVTFPAGYALSRKDMYGYKLINVYMIVTMYFHGGLIPTFLVIKGIGLVDKPYTLLILGAVSVFNCILTRTFIQSSIPGELQESARIDGCTDIGIMFRIILPLSTPVIAVLTLYYGIAHWNDYFSALIYVNTREYSPLQIFLREILVLQAQFTVMDPEAFDFDAMVTALERARLAQVMRYGLIVVASVPMLILYPFVQRYFVQGVMIGALKG